MDALNKQDAMEALSGYMQGNISFFVSGYQLMKSVRAMPAVTAATDMSFFK
jgi:hypothetical protein